MSDRTDTAPHPTWWIEQPIEARIRAVQRSKEYLDRTAGYGLLSIPVEVVEQAVWLALREAHYAPSPEEQ